MDEIPRGSQEFHSPVAGNESPSSTGNEEQSTQSRTNGTAARQATGPRTAQGKKRSKLNALKHGLFFKAILLEGDSPFHYGSLVEGLENYYQPQGAMELIDVENLAALLWRKCRLYMAENAMISENIASAEFDTNTKRYTEAWEKSRAATASGGLLKDCNNPLVVREALRLFEIFRDIFIKTGFREDSRILKKLYGQDQDGRTPDGFYFFYELYAKVAKKSKEDGDAAGAEKLKEIMLIFIDVEFERLKEWEKQLNAYQRQNIEYKLSTAVIPDQKAMDTIMRCETHISREIEKLISRIERSQRIRKGQPLPPQLEVKIS